ncbi:MAG: LarC family nickel insertion protein [Mogibacterium sp.]|nr:LarC family nickel insertion protein [Mogibacterium sp.]
MKLMYIDCSMGAAGDMLTAALLELLDAGERAAFIEEFNSLGLPGIVMETESSVKCGVEGTHVHMLVNGAEEDEHMHDHIHAHHHEHHSHEDGHMHEHDHHHHTHGHDDTAAHTHTHTHDGVPHTHSHNGVAEIRHIVRDHLELPENVREDILKVYDIIGDAESKAHGVPITEVHFHEVGTMDAIADVTAVCLLIDRIKPQKIAASPVNVGGGTVKCAHGVLPVPAPATANILEGIPSYSGDIKSELCTPTGAALLRYFADEFCEMPEMQVERQGFGMGTKDFERANCVRVTLGETD